MLDDLKIFGELARGIFPVKAPQTGIGEEYVVKDAKAFNAAKFLVKIQPASDSTTPTMDMLNLKEGDVLTYVGRGSGDKKMYRFDTEDGQIAHIHMTWKADGKPETFGLAKQESTPAQRKRTTGYGLNAD